MAGLTFPGGVHPPEYKELTEHKATVNATVPKLLVIPMRQHIGAPCDALVKVGDEVKVGQKIGEPKGFVSAPIHSSVSGKVVAVDNFPHPGGANALSVVIENDGKDEWVDGISGIDDYLKADPETLRDKILEAGIVGLGGATFPTHVKLTPPKEKKIEFVILNGCECEPYLTADHRLMVESPDDVVEGLRILMKVLGVQKGYIGIEDNKPDAIAKMTEAVRSIPNIEVTTHLVKYPQGAEKQLIKAALGREVPSGGLPMDVGVVVQNVGTAAAIYQAVKYGRPLIDRIVTVTGQGVKEPKNLKVRIGTLLRDLIDDCGGFEGTPGKVVSGGPMMGQAQWTVDVPAIKGTSGVLVFPDSKVMAYELNPSEQDINACIRCGECVRHCPMMLNPSLLSIYGERDMFDESQKIDVFDCIECGVCTFVCPAKRPLMHLIRYSKNIINAKKKK